MKKGYIVEIMGTDCTAGGVTSGHKDALLIGEGVPEIFEQSSERPTLVLRRGPGGRQYVAEPLVQPEGMCGPMFGGHFIYTSDSRFPSDQPIHVHDRFETWETYNAMSI